MTTDNTERKSLLSSLISESNSESESDVDSEAWVRGLISESDSDFSQHLLQAAINNDTKKVVNHEFKEEKDIFDYLGMDYVEPEKR